MAALVSLSRNNHIALPAGVAKIKKAHKLLAGGDGINKVAKAVGLSNGTVARIKAAT